MSFRCSLEDFSLTEALSMVVIMRGFIVISTDKENQSAVRCEEYFLFLWSLIGDKCLMPSFLGIR